MNINEMKRLLNILLISSSLIAIFYMTGKADVAERNDNNTEIVTISNIEVLDIPLENQLRRVISKDFTNLQRTVSYKTQETMTATAAIYTLPKRVHNISSHLTNFDIKTGSHKFISYGILRV